MLADLLPGVTINGPDVGRWLERQRQHIVWQGLMDAQQGRLAALGIQPEAPKKPPRGALTPSHDGPDPVQGAHRVRDGPQEHMEDLGDEQGGTVAVKLGAWIPKSKSRRAKLTAEQLNQLALLGLDWHCPRPGPASSNNPG
ncbi:helicase associated domain-containing protein [Streptomyces sp. SP17BM10]|uniref:helicase associated domain-containing protein n=1 Tax=Streptomyces sp. SP17BM10 TaxID=3002530 RepID=UPI002E7A841B|nr:helicase associated domain-containing protein [Streptomyces sp. SP17BM10]MEE1782667.1 helicase associated domain-containing protein [Streptomyces sp. SP17BM10]